MGKTEEIEVIQCARCGTVNILVCLAKCIEFIGIFHIFAERHRHTHTHTTYLEMSAKVLYNKVLRSKFVHGLRQNVAFDIRYVVLTVPETNATVLRAHQKTFKFNLILLFELRS